MILRVSNNKSARATRAQAPEWYLAFAEWRADIQRRTDAWRTVKFFRQSRSHTILWTEVMRGHYTRMPPSVSACVALMPCARMTARKIIALAEAKGYFARHPAADDSRKKLLTPSPRCVAEYEAMVDEFLQLAERLGARRLEQERSRARRKK